MNVEPTQGDTRRRRILCRLRKAVLQVHRLHRVLDGIEVPLLRLVKRQLLSLVREGTCKQLYLSSAKRGAVGTTI